MLTKQCKVIEQVLTFSSEKSRDNLNDFKVNAYFHPY